MDSGFRRNDEKMWATSIPQLGVRIQVGDLIESYSWRSTKSSSFCARISHTAMGPALRTVASRQ
jgi:hypothetical protein